MSFATSTADLPDIAQMRAMTGLDFMRRMQDGELPQPPIAQAMNFVLTEVSEGRAVFEGTPRFAHLNPMGGVHGGWYGAILDSAMGCALMTKVPQGSTYATLEFKINLCLAVPCDSRMRATGRVDHSGRTTGVASAELRGREDDRLYATASCTCLIRALPEH
jgi:uncharacterized protein (TIGR00369 family)